MYYKYKGTEILSKSLLDDMQINTNIMHICAYKVNTEGKYPFQEFLMINNPISDRGELMVPFMYLTEDLLLEDDAKIMNDVSYKASYILSHIVKFDYMKNTVCINGFFEFNKEIFVFIDITEQFKSNMSGTFALMDEIVNRQKVNETPIQNYIFSLFIMNDPLCFLLNMETEEQYEIPTTGYVCKEKNKVSFTSIFGQTTEDGILGPYFYFNSHKNAQNKKTSNGGIIRFALFTGNTKYIENLPDDPIDDSRVKRERLEDPNIDQMYEKMTLRITDYDGTWANKYDSVYLAQLELDNGDFVKDAPMLVIKEHCQQIPLTIY